MRWVRRERREERERRGPRHAVPFVPAVFVLVVMAGAGYAGHAVLEARREPPPPWVDPALRRTVVPVVRDHLERDIEGGIGRGMLARSATGPRPRVFCHVHVIEVVRREMELLTGVHAHCQEFAVRGRALVGGTAYAMPMRVTLRSGGGHHASGVTRVDRPRDGAGFAPSVRRMFTEAGAAEALRIAGRGLPGGEGDESPQARARRAYGLAPDLGRPAPEAGSRVSTAQGSGGLGVWRSRGLGVTGAFSR